MEQVSELQRLNLPFHYYELQKSGFTVKQIAKLFNCSSRQVERELLLHPLNKDLSKSEYLPRYPSSYSRENCRQTSFKCHQYIIDAIDAISGTNRRSKIIEAIELYLELDVKPIPSLKPTRKDPAVAVRVPISLLQELESLPGTKSQHFTAAIEYFILKYLK